MSGTQTDIGIKDSNNAEYGGFEKPSPAEYNKSVGNLPKAPTSGGPKQEAFDALLKPGNAID